jgi:hypothetical protein
MRFSCRMVAASDTRQSGFTVTTASPFFRRMVSTYMGVSYVTRAAEPAWSPTHAPAMLARRAFKRSFL